MKNKRIIDGDYVFTEIPNAFNNKASWWISKKGYTVAYYCFTPMDKRDLNEHLDKDVLKTYEDYFETRIKALTA